MIESYQKTPRERYKTISEEDKSKRQRITKKDVKVLLRKVKKKRLYYREHNENLYEEQKQEQGLVSISFQHKIKLNATFVKNILTLSNTDSITEFKLTNFINQFKFFSQSKIISMNGIFAKRR